MNSIIEVTFGERGNTIVGNYSEYRKLDDAIMAKNVFIPYGLTVKADLCDFRRLVEYVHVFGHCIKTLAGFARACDLAGVELVKEAV